MSSIEEIEDRFYSAYEIRKEADEKVFPRLLRLWRNAGFPENITLIEPFRNNLMLSSHISRVDTLYASFDSLEKNGWIQIIQRGKNQYTPWVFAFTFGVKASGKQPESSSIEQSADTFNVKASGKQSEITESAFTPNVKASGKQPESTQIEQSADTFNVKANVDNSDDLGGLSIGGVKEEFDLADNNKSSKDKKDNNSDKEKKKSLRKNESPYLNNPPSPLEVHTYFFEKTGLPEIEEYTIAAKLFCDAFLSHYTLTGWRYGKQKIPIINWKLSAKTEWMMQYVKPQQNHGRTTALSNRKQSSQVNPAELESSVNNLLARRRAYTDHQAGAGNGGYENDAVPDGKKLEF
jgi:hypothetical protein